jgi:hypothetical protein
MERLHYIPHGSEQEAAMQKIKFSACGPAARLSRGAILDLALVYLAALGLRVFARRAIAFGNEGAWPIPALPLWIATGACLALLVFLFARILRRDENWTLYLAGALAAAMLANWQLASEHAGIAEIALALLPLLPAALVVRALVRMLRQADELQRRVLHQGLAFAFAVTFSAAFVWAVLEGIGLPRAPAVAWCAVLVISWAVGLGIFSKRYEGETTS